MHPILLNLIPLQQGHLTKPSMDQGSALAGRGGAPLGLDVHSGRQVLLPLSISSLWQENETPRAPRAAPSFPFFSFSPLFQSLFSVIVCHVPTPHAQGCPSLSLFNPPVSPLESQPPPPPSRPVPPQSPFSCLEPFVLTVVCQLGLHFESKSKTVCCEKMEKW